VPVIAIQSVEDAKPHKALAVLQNAIHRAMGKPLLDGDAFEFDALALHLLAGADAWVENECKQKQMNVAGKFGAIP
jgi:hypothetical protein